MNVCDTRTNIRRRISLSMTARATDMAVPVRMKSRFRYSVFQITRAATVLLKKNTKLSMPAHSLPQMPS